MSVILRIRDKATGVWKEIAALIGPKGDKGDPGIGVPSGGSFGQFLKKKSNTDFDTEWNDITGIIPSGGTTNQVLRKKSNNDYDVGWISYAIPAPAISNPADLGSAAFVGSSDNYAKEDHVHKRPTVSEIGAIPTNGLNSYIITEDKTQSNVSIAGNDITGPTIPVSKAGYTFIGVVGISLSNTNVLPRRLNKSGNNVFVGMKNLSDSTQTTDVTITCLYVKNS